MPTHDHAPEHERTERTERTEQKDESKLTLNRDTLRDLDAADGGDVKGAAAAETVNACVTDRCQSIGICR